MLEDIKLEKINKAGKREKGDLAELQFKQSDEGETG